MEIDYHPPVLTERRPDLGYSWRVDEVRAEILKNKPPAKQVVCVYDPRGNACREIVCLQVNQESAIMQAQAEVPGGIVYHVYIPVSKMRNSADK